MKGLCLIVLLCLNVISEVHSLKYWKDNRSEDLQRGFKVQKSNPVQFEIRATRDNAQDGDVIDFLFSLAPWPRWVVQYYNQETDNNAASSTRWSLWKLIEYTESGANEGFNPTEDTKVSSYPLFNSNSNNKWDHLSYTSSTDDEGTQIYTACTSLSPKTVSGAPNVDICAQWVSKSSVVNGSDASPNAMKWSFNVANYAYKGSNTRLALKVGFDSTTDVTDLPASDDSDVASDEGALQLSSEGGIQAAISWITSVDVVGKGCNATAQVVKSAIYNGQPAADVDYFPGQNDNDGVSWGRTVRIAYFSFLTNCQAQAIYWDPEMGIITTSGTAAFAPVFALILVALFAF